MNMGLGISFLGKMLESGKAIGTKMSLTKVTETLQKNHGVVSEKIGDMLGGKGKDIMRKLEETGSFEEITAKLNELAQKYTEASVKLGIKKSKQGFTVLQTSVQNGDKTLLKEAVSVGKDGTIKTRGALNGTSTQSFIDNKTGSFSFRAEKGADRISVSGNKNDSIIANLTSDGQNALSAQIKRGKNVSGTQFGYESVDGLTYFNLGKNGAGVSGVYDNALMSQFIKKEAIDGHKSINKFVEIITGKNGGDGATSILLQILRPLRERFNTAIDLKKYNGHTNFERFLSPDELKSELGKIIGEEKSLTEKIEKFIKKSNVSSREISLKDCPEEVRSAFEYREQIRSDIGQAKELIKIYC